MIWEDAEAFDTKVGRSRHPWWVVPRGVFLLSLGVLRMQLEGIVRNEREWIEDEIVLLDINLYRHGSREVTVLLLQPPRTISEFVSMDAAS